MTEEIWKPIKGYEKSYLISNYGRVKSLDRIAITVDGVMRHYKGKILSTTPNKHRGYVAVKLSDSNRRISEVIDVHRLVALHFLPNPNNLPVVNHRDCKRSNSHVDNLQWVTVSENLTYKGAHLRAGESRKKKVFQYSMDGEYIRSYSWASEAAQDGFYPNCITQACCGFKPHYRGFKWTY
jgi:hypothetical protein